MSKRNYYVCLNRAVLNKLLKFKYTVVEPLQFESKA